MKINNLTAELHMPNALKSKMGAGGVETALSLPPANRQLAYAVDEYPACPTNWEHGSDVASSYFVAVKPGKGMWLDFNSCRKHTHDVAIVVSIQGVNSVTGQKTSTMGLEQYRSKCPVHDVEFQQDRFCPECKYKWPAQNYLSTTGTPRGMLWLDGFRSADGVVRQYVFTEDEARGVAAKKIGKDRVYAIGVAFYLSKEAKPTPVSSVVMRGMTIGDVSTNYSDTITTHHAYYNASGIKVNGQYNDSFGSAPAGAAGGSSGNIWMDSKETSFSDFGSEARGLVSEEVKCCGSFAKSASMVEAPSAAAPPPEPVKSPRIKKTSNRVAEDFKQITPTTTYEVAAGARIDQEVYADPKELSYWEEKPAGLIYINYTDDVTLSKILAAGKRKEETDGFLSDVAVGNE